MEATRSWDFRLSLLDDTLQFDYYYYYGAAAVVVCSFINNVYLFRIFYAHTAAAADITKIDVVECVR